MAEITFDTVFAQVTFWAKGTGLTVTKNTSKQCPKPEGMVRIDWCRLGSLKLNCSQGSVFDIGLDYSCKEGWEDSIEGGEAFMCSLFEHMNGSQAAIGLRDYEWNERQQDLIILSAAQLPAKPRVKYKANSSAAREFEISLALTKSPIDDFEALSPWLYVDKVLKF